MLYESKFVRTAYELFQKEDVLANRGVFQRYLEQIKAAIIEPSELLTQSPEFYLSLYDSFAKHRDFSRFCQELFSKSIAQGKIWGNKLLQKEELEILFKLFPRAHFIIIVRDVRSVVYSASLFNKANYYTAALLWADNSRYIKRIQRENADIHIMFLRYEDLVRDSSKILENISAFVGLDTSNDFSMAATAHTKSIDKWRKHLKPKEVRQIEEICFNEMKFFGYDPEIADGPRKMRLSRFIISVISQLKGRFIKNKGGLRGALSLKSLRRYLKGLSAGIS